ncbi:MAG: ATP-dependent Clp protease adaptor ClpS [Bacteroidales bacterium]|nr:ATP-dependent Clp protease adaptor ClpS [Tenuifilaceae bacterium]
MGRKSTGSPSEVHDSFTNIQPPSSLILFNDEVNDYQFVIDTLVEVCEHNNHQAEQCTLIAHYKGKCDVKTGPLQPLRLMRDELLRRGLSATIN